MRRAQKEKLMALLVKLEHYLEPDHHNNLTLGEYHDLKKEVEEQLTLLAK